MSRARQFLGCWLHERWRTEAALRGALGRSWRDLHNRNETLEPGSDAESRVCRWESSSWLTVARVFPSVGGRVLAAAARDWRFELQHRPLAPCNQPVVSVVIPVAGAERRTQFSAVVASFMAQSVLEFELLVVEHSPAPEYLELCPPGVRYVHLQRSPTQGFNKSLALNEGARRARAPYLVLHDGDILAPVRYLAAAAERLERGFDGVQPLRFVFYLDQAGSTDLVAAPGRLPRRVHEVGHNFPGGSTVVRVDTYWAIGGHDERFQERGGDDNDFLDRLKTKRFFFGGYAPGVHLWHPTDPTARNSPEMSAFKRAQLARPAAARIADLLSRR